ncbi:MAG TPA: hypothetical protein PLD47_00220 [Aggregatilineales bacterium]|nr:hypothetical protein [Anaerolineales bacterium]HRE46122.1 hypothetical protein [Aggregatilineales bacterium]
MLTSLNENLVQLDLTRAEVVWLLRLLNLPPLPSVGTMLTFAQPANETQAGALLNAMQSLQIRRIAVAKGETIEIDPIVAGMLSACGNAHRVIRIGRIAPPETSVYHIFVAEKLYVLMEQPLPFTNSFYGSTDRNEIAALLGERLKIPPSEALPIPEQNIDGEEVENVRTALRKGGQEALEALTAAGWEIPIANTFTGALARPRAYIACAVFDGVTPEPKRLNAVELLVSERGVVYMQGNAPLAIGSIDGSAAVGAILGMAS